MLSWAPRLRAPLAQLSNLSARSPLQHACLLGCREVPVPSVGQGAEGEGRVLLPPPGPNTVPGMEWPLINVSEEGLC